MQSQNKRDTTGALIWGISLSLAGLVSLAVSRVVHVLKGKKEISMPRIDSGPLGCAPATGIAPARAARAIAVVKSNGNLQHASAENSDEIPVLQSTRVITMRGIFQMGAPVTAPAIDPDDFANLDD